MKTTVYEIENGQRNWMWDSYSETPDLSHLKRAFGFLAAIGKDGRERYYEVEQNGAVVLTIRKESATVA